MNILTIRKMLGMTQKEFADAIGVDKSVVFKYEHGLTKPSKKRIERINHLLSCAGFGTCVEELVFGEAQPDHLIAYQSDIVRRLIIKGADGCCELCGEKAPFLDKDGRPYLCLHTIDRYNREINVVNNSVVLCPNCNAKISVLGDEKDITLLKEKALKHNY